jgi:hypothetical protein
MIKRRLGPPPHANGAKTPALQGCPDIFELKNGDIAIIGIDKTEQLQPHLPADASCGEDERIVVVPKKIIEKAKMDLTV